MNAQQIKIEEARFASIERQIQSLCIPGEGPESFQPTPEVKTFLTTIASYAALERLRSRPWTKAKQSSIDSGAASIVGRDAIKREFNL